VEALSKPQEALVSCLEAFKSHPEALTPLLETLVYHTEKALIPQPEALVYSLELNILTGST